MLPPFYPVIIILVLYVDNPNEFSDIYVSANNSNYSISHTLINPFPIVVTMLFPIPNT